MFNFIKNLRTDNEKTKLQKELSEFSKSRTFSDKKDVTFFKNIDS